MNWTVYEIMLNTMQSILFVTFIRSMLTPQRHERIAYIACIILTASALSTYIFLPMPSWDTWTFVFVFVYALLFFKESPLIKLFWCMVMLICISSFAGLTYQIAGLVLNNNISIIQEPGIPRVIFTLLYSSLLFIIFYIMARFLPKQVNTIPSLLLLLSIDLICVFLIDLYFEFLFDNNIPLKGFFIASIFTTIIGILTIIMYIILGRYAKREQEHQYREILLQDSLSQAEDLRNVYDTMLRLRHDMRAYVTDVKDMISRGELKQSQPYLDNLEKQVADLFSTGNTALDSVLSVKYAKMQRNQIEFRGSGLHYTLQLRLSDYALCSLISNMLDNAIEALLVRKSLPGEHYVSLLCAVR